jgi:hypothetical protein
VAARVGGGEPTVRGVGGGLPAAAHRGEGKSQHGGARSVGRGWRWLLPHRGGGQMVSEQQIRGS